jgi:hypothetical protein
MVVLRMPSFGFESFSMHAAAVFTFLAIGPATLVACIFDSPCIICAVLWAVVDCGCVIHQGWNLG